MNRQQFIIMALFTAAETYFFNESIMEQRYIVALLYTIKVYLLTFYRGFLGI